MFAVNENVLGVPQMTVQLTLADWQKFLGRDGGNLPQGPLPYPGKRVRATDAIFGEAWFMLAYGVAGLQVGDTVMIGAAYASTRTVAATRGVVGVSMSANTDPTALSWFCLQGQVPVRATAAAANLPLYATATAGSAASTVVATQGMTGGFVLTALAAAIGTKSVGTTNGSPLIRVANLDGLYVGAGVTGTGIAGGSTIVAIGAGGQMLGSPGPQAFQVQLSANATATGQVTGTFAHGAAFALGHLQNPVMAGLG